MSFHEAIRDYRFLKDRGYPDKAALKLVSDRYRLGGVERNCLFRGVMAAGDSRRRLAKLVGAARVEGRPLGVDWYNVLITVESYLKGFPVFLADDGLLRDASATHGSYRTGTVTRQAENRISGILATLRADRVEVFLDAPISFSGAMAERLRRSLARHLRAPFTVSVHPSADFPLKSFPGVVATSDSTIVDRPGVEAVFDLAREVLERSYGACIPALEELQVRG